MTPIVRQRSEGDCGIAAISTFTGISYEDVYLEAAKIDRAHRGKNGLWNYQIVLIARRLGTSLRQTRRFKLQRDEGVLHVYFWGAKAVTSPGGHFVAVIGGEIGCPHDGTALPYREWLDQNKATAITLMKGRRREKVIA